MGNYVIAVRNYLIVSPPELGNYVIADTRFAAGSSWPTAALASASTARRPG
jgi:hypothetical protein